MTKLSDKNEGIIKQIVESEYEETTDGPLQQEHLDEMARLIMASRKFQTVGELIEHLQTFDESLPIILVDTTTDDPNEGSYGLAPQDIVKTLLQDEDGNPCDGVVIEFENKLNPNPLD